MEAGYTVMIPLMIFTFITYATMLVFLLSLLVVNTGPTLRLELEEKFGARRLSSFFLTELIKSTE